MSCGPLAMRIPARRLIESTFYVAALCSTVCLALAKETEDNGSRVRPSVGTVQPRSGFQIELVACEPLIEDPVAFDWGADGKLYVVEMRDYPLGMDNKGEPGGRVVVLDDTDGDGRYDTSTVFLDELLFPNGIMSWRKGVLVTSAPDIFYAEDTDGDGRADKREVLFTGFGEANPQHRINGLRWGLDNWVYCANGDFAVQRDFDPAAQRDALASGFSASQSEDLRRLSISGSDIKSVKTGATFNIRNRDFRIRPDKGELDPQTGQAQFGRDRNDWGDWFGCNHSTHLWHFALDDYYLRRNPYVNYPAARVQMPPAVTYPIGATGRETGSGRSSNGNSFTSACGIMIYRDELFGEQFASNSFTCEPVHNLVHREVLASQGATYSSRRAADEPHSEFLASTDVMFTPVSARTGPDGAIWIADMYRRVLEHPHWLPQGWERTIDVRAGQGMGRIYRVYPVDRVPRGWPNLATLDATKLVAQLESPNGWLRDKAQQLLVERQDRSVVGPLEKLAIDGRLPLGRLHALYTLDGLQALSPVLLQRALDDTNSGVRRHAVRLSDAFANQAPEIAEKLAAMVSDAEPAVRLQLGYSLGNWQSPACGAALARLLREQAADPYVTAAAISSLTSANLSVVAHTLTADLDSIPKEATVAVLQTASGFNDSTTLASLLHELTEAHHGSYSAKQLETLASWLDTIQQSERPLAVLLEQQEPALRQELLALNDVAKACRGIVQDAEAPMSLRVAALGMLGRMPDAKLGDSEIVLSLIAPQTHDELQVAAVRALGRVADQPVFGRLFDDWSSHTPNLRTHILEVILNRSDGAAVILEAISDGRVLPMDVPLVFRQRLIEESPRSEQAARLFEDRINADREQIIEAYKDALSLPGDTGNGLRVFAKACSACHRSGVVGTAIGPDLTTIRDKPPEWFLPAIFDPSRAVDARYFSYVVVTKDGLAISGVPIEEGSTSLTIVSATGQQHRLLRSNIDEMTSSGKSVMPEGFESELQAQDVADLIAFLKSESPSPKVVDFNRPELVRPDAEGVLQLLAKNCEVFGNEIKIWDKYQCLGWWNSREDKAVWTFELPKPGRYSVLLNWSCDDGSAGNRYSLKVADTTIVHPVESSGGWETYRIQKIGEVDLSAGVSKLTLQAEGGIAPETYLFDLREVRLQPLRCDRELK